MSNNITAAIGRHKNNINENTWRILFVVTIILLFSTAFAAVTEYDLTGLATGADVSHQHVYIDAYDETYHYKKCIICNNVINKSEHHKVDNWLYPFNEYERCHPYNRCVTTCSDNCGYSKEWKDSHI